MEGRLHLLTTERFIVDGNQEYSFLIQHKFIETCINLDVSIFEPYMEEANVFENKEKYLFLHSLKKLFQPYQSKTNVFSVRSSKKVCLGCSKGKLVLQFTIYFTKDGTEVDDFGFVIDKENDILKDIYRCWQYQGCQPCQIQPEGLPAINIQGFSCK